MGRFANSWAAAKASGRVLKQDKELLLFPVFSGIASLLVIATFVAPLYAAGLIGRAFTNKEPAAEQTVTAVFFLAYLILAFVTIYFNAALMFAANERLAGGNPTIGSGLAGANRRLGKIFAWSLFAATVNLLLNALERSMRDRNNLVGSILAGLVGTAWTLATFFVIPVVVLEDVGPFAALKRSAGLFKKTWGESVVGVAGIGLVFGVLQFAVILGAAFLLFLTGGVLGAVGTVAVIALAVLALLALSIVQQAVGGIYRVALFRYTTQGQIAQQFPGWIIQNAAVTRP